MNTSKEKKVLNGIASPNLPLTWDLHMEISPPPSQPKKTEFVSSMVRDAVGSLKEGPSKQRQEDDGLDAFGKYIASRLRSMDRDQKLYAEKIISDIVFEGEMKRLTASIF